MAIVEGTVNVALGAALGRRHPVWTVEAEQTGQLVSEGAAADTRRVDIVIHPMRRGAVPVLIEAEFAPAGSVEADAVGRLGATVRLEACEVERVVAVRLPEHLKEGSDKALEEAVEAATYEWCLLSSPSVETAPPKRWPEAGWLSGTVDELARFCEMLLVDERGLEEAAAAIVNSIDALTEDLRGIASDREQMRHVRRVMGEHVDSPDTEDELLREKRETQATQMALMMLANAFLFERVIIDSDNPPPEATRWKKSGRGDTKLEVLDNWQSILRHNYWPIFTIARDILNTCVRDKTAKTDVIPRLSELAERLTSYGVAETGDITGQLFGKLISDRKYLATFYTLPPSAYLMAELVASRLDERGVVPTGPGDTLRQLRIADLACGTGALLTSLYQRLAARIRSAGADDAKSHKDFIEHVFQAVDVMPAAAHITATLLASAHPNVLFDRSNVVLAPYGLPLSETVPAYLDVLVEEGLLVVDPGGTVTAGEVLAALRQAAAALGADEATTAMWDEQAVAECLRGIAKGVKRVDAQRGTWAGLRLETSNALSQPAANKAPQGVRRRVRVGSLDLLDEAYEVSNRLFPAGSEQVAMGGTGEAQIASLPHDTLDVCVMNPPFTSNTADRTENTPPFPEFAGLGNTQQAQDAMKARKNALTRKRARALAQPRPGQPDIMPAADGHAGLATNFADLADAKLKDDGVVGLILPLATLTGESWRKTRALLTTRYDDIVVITLAATGTGAQAFSADTGMGECMIVARRTSKTPAKGRTITYVSLRRRPAELFEGVEVARLIDAVRRDDTLGRSSTLQLGGAVYGKWARDQEMHGHYASTREMDVVTTARALRTGDLDLPQLPPMSIKMTSLKEVGEVGPGHRQIGNKVGKKESTEGCFDVEVVTGDRSAWRTLAYPVLWGRAPKHEQTLEVLPDCNGTPKTGKAVEAKLLAQTASSQLHFAQHFRLTSQSSCACLTPKPTLGGNQWPSYLLHEQRWQYAAVLWHNTTLGLMSWWLSASRQQLGRPIITRSALGDLPTLDFRALSDNQHDSAKEIYHRFTTSDTTLTFLPASEAYHDDARHELDRAVLEELLGFNWDELQDPLDTLRHQWCAEPTVNGGKTTRPGYQHVPKTAREFIHVLKNDGWLVPDADHGEWSADILDVLQAAAIDAGINPDDAATWDRTQLNTHLRRALPGVELTTKRDKERGTFWQGLRLAKRRGEAPKS